MKKGKFMDFSREFLRLACEKGVLRFGEFITKAGRRSPYFFNSGLFDDGASFRALCGFYVEAILASGIAFDGLFGPAYKGIPLVTGVAIRLAERGFDKPFSFDRKEAKDHGEGGRLIGAPLRGRILIVDDVISAGTSVRASIELIRAHGAEPAGVVIALDRMERGEGEESAAQEVSRRFGIPVIAVATLENLLALLADDPRLREHLPAVRAYRERYGVQGEAARRA